MATAQTITIGSISRATLKTDGLLEAFAPYLDDDTRELAEAFVVLLRNDIMSVEEDASVFLNETVMDALNELSPEYCYFGAHEGDGSDFGFWPSWDSIESAVHDGELLKVSDTSEVPADYCGGVIHVNDHGNATLYHADNGKLTEIWSIV